MSDSERQRGGTAVTAPAARSVGERHVAKEACLVAIYGLTLGKKFNLNPGEIIIGRSSKAGIQIDLEAVSRNHCMIINTGDEIVLRDLGSTNGTYVNDEVTDERPLHDGDLVKVGSCILKFLNSNNIEHAYHEEIYRLATVDGLTQVLNRRYFVEALEREVGKAVRHHRNMSLILIDIDRFKSINESFGTLAGDHVLAHLTSVITARLRDEDVLGRVGGDEFAIALPEIDGDGAIQFAEKLRKLVEVSEFKFEDAVIAATVSIGVAPVLSGIEPVDNGVVSVVARELLKRADTRLQAAKEGGGNRVVEGADVKILLPHPDIKPMLAFREAIMRSAPVGSVLLAVKLANDSVLRRGSRDSVHIARRRLEYIVFSVLGGTLNLVGRGDAHVLLLVIKDREDVDRVQREITALLASDQPVDLPPLIVAFGPPIALAGDVAAAIANAIDFVPAGSSGATPGWAQQVALPLGILVRSLFLSRDSKERIATLVALHEGMTRWLLLWLWSEVRHLAQLDRRIRDTKHTEDFRLVVSVDFALDLLQATVRTTAAEAHRFQSHHAWDQLFGGELNTLAILNGFLAFRDELAGRTREPKSSAACKGDEHVWEASLLQILRVMSLLAAPIVPGKNEHALRNRFMGATQVLIGDNAVVGTDSMRFATSVKTGHLYLFAPSSSPISVEPFAVYERCPECGGREVFIAEAIDKDGRYVYWSPSTNHSMTGPAADERRGPDGPTQTQLLAPPDILVITALEEERDALLAHLQYEILPKDDDDVGIFYRADVVTRAEHRYRVLVTMLQGMGPLQASTRAMYAAMRWRPRFVLMTGIAGGRSGVTALGDVIVASQVADYSVGKVAGRTDRKIYWHVYQANAALLEAVHAFSSGWENQLNVQRPGPGSPRRHVGVIASGGDVVEYQTLIDRYAGDWAKLIGVEMEGGGIATALHQSPSNAGFVMIRGVSDHADVKKNAARVKKWRPYAADAAAAYAVGLIRSGLIPMAGSAYEHASPTRFRDRRQ
jgi:two-component system, cell cycle response regulator